MCHFLVQGETKAVDRETDWEGKLCGEARLHHQARAVLTGGAEAAARFPVSRADAVRPRVHQAGQRAGRFVLRLETLFPDENWR